MSITLEPTTLRMASSPAPGVCDAVASVKAMSVQELRAELRGRRGVTTAERERLQREAAKADAARAAEALRNLA